MTARDSLLELGREALARGAFLEAHEHFEDAWRSSVAPEKAVVQALAQLAAALVHRSRGRERGAVRVLAKARRKLAGAPAFVGPIETARVAAAIDAVLAGADRVTP